MAQTKYVSRENLSNILSKIKATYVPAEEGKSLIPNELLTKLGGISAGAQVNVIETIKVNGEALTVTEKGVDITVPTQISDFGAVTEDNLDAALKEKVNASAAANHSHENKTELDLIQIGDKAKWDAAEQNAKDYADGLNTTMDGRVTAAEGKITTLIGEDADKSVRTIANEELAKQLIPENASASLDELQEIAAWIQAHPEDAAAMNAAISALQAKVDTGDKTVTAYVQEYADGLNTAMNDRVAEIEGDYVKASELVAFTEEEIDEIWNAA